MPTPANIPAQFDALRQSLDARRKGTLGPDEFIVILHRDARPLCDALPEKFRGVLEDICMRLESSRLFSADSCSFSDKELLNALQTWIERAELRWQETQTRTQTQAQTQQQQQ